MGCSCKVGQHISQIEKRYGVSAQPQRTQIREYSKMLMKNGLLFLLALPFLPLMIVFVLLRRVFTKKPISIYKLFKIKR
jgi:hypothetical protein